MKEMNELETKIITYKEMNITETKIITYKGDE